MGYCNRPLRNPYQTHEISSAQDIHFIYSIILKFCTKHDNDAAVLCAKFQNDWTTKEEMLEQSVFPPIFSFEKVSNRFVMLQQPCIITSPAFFIDIINP